MTSRPVSSSYTDTRSTCPRAINVQVERFTWREEFPFQYVMLEEELRRLYNNTITVALI